jgi:glycosyltransferase involved in cell wall biosynthesis
MSDVVILVPVLRRPQRVQPLLTSVAETTPQPHRVLFICDHDDVDEQRAIRAAGAEMLICSGSYAIKINAGAEATDEPLVFLGADDLRFHRRWLETALTALTGDVGVVGTNDLGNRRVRVGRHATHNLVTRDYIARGTIDEPGKVLHEGYRHNFCDDELVQTARLRRAWAFARRSVVEHLHPDWGKAQDDDVYRYGKQTFEIDRGLFRERRALWT